jgi:hypothetical protein
LLSNEKQGNCYSLAVLFKLFSDRLQSDARLTITLHHIYIQNRNQRGGFYNVELASKTFPGDGTIQTLTYTTNTSIMNGMAQRMLSDKEAVALNLIYLAKAYQHKYKDNTNDFLLQCADLAFKYDTLSMNALLLKAEVTENRLLAAMKINKITTLPKARTNPQTQKLIKIYEDQLSNLYALGYREIPKEIEKNILAHIQHRNEGYILKDQTPNPFASIKAKTRYKTLSNGLFDEMHEAVDTIQYYHALLNTKTKKIIKLLPIEASDEYKVDPVVFALSVDPLSDKYPNISPYAYCAWNPVVLTDPDGRKIVIVDPESGKRISYSANMKIKKNYSRFVSDAINGLNFLNNNPENGINRVAETIKAENTLKIVKSKDGETNYVGTEQTLSWENTKADDFGEGVQSAIIGLAHDFDHGWRSILSWDKMQQMESQNNTQGDDYMNTVSEAYMYPELNSTFNWEQKAMQFENYIGSKEKDGKKISTYMRTEYKAPVKQITVKDIFSIE